MDNRVTILLTLLLFTACARGNQAPAVTAPNEPAPTVAQAQATALPTVETTVVLTEVTAIALPSPAEDWVNTVNVEGDYYIRGNPDAPVLLTDYSDFL
ncbi:MAG: hypothetical protein M3Q45_13330 [Chloroflexota bacterium]|nr:hypothetical protein [Chloroflexota bacterium]